LAWRREERTLKERWFHITQMIVGGDLEKNTCPGNDKLGQEAPGRPDVGVTEGDMSCLTASGGNKGVTWGVGKGLNVW